ncbi:hypothetical protein [Flavobacterium sp.]|uniref:hypothetical protein n=1 Tax=Flavobacterium sp. TaxID=239 RepID=UPI002B4B04C8|nr:hypothetical protein [Flavobacterium sp.]HLF53224.1 hypothetical protein [Flavobacterium sp.]
MKIMLLLALLMGLSSNGYAQTDFGDQSFAIPPLNSNVKVIKNSAPTSHFPSINFPPITLPLKSTPFNNNSLPSSLRKIGEKDVVNFMQKQPFRNSNEIYQKRLVEKNTDEKYRLSKKNQYLGDFKTKSRFVRIHFFDYQEIDGDIISIYINGIEIASNIVLQANLKVRELTFEKGMNKIEIQAITQGDSGLNTAQFEIYDELGNLLYANQWNLEAGYKATVVVIRE